MKTRIHVLSVAGNLGFGGDENRLLSFAQGMDRDRFRLTLVLTSPSDSPEVLAGGSMKKEFERAGVEVLQVDRSSGPTGRIGVLKRIGASITQIQRLILKLGIDVVDARLDAGSIAGVPAARWTGRPSVVTDYAATPVRKYPMWQVARQATFGSADFVITDSQIRAREIRQWMLRPNPQIRVIPNGISPPRPERGLAETRAALGIPTDRNLLIIGQISGLVPYKGHGVVLEAAQQILKRDPRVFFLFIGFARFGVDYVRELEQKVASLDIVGRVRIASYPGAIGDVWQLLDIHVHGTLWDSLPNAIIEGMSLAKPLVATMVGGIPEMVRSGKTGLLVPPGDSTALASAVLQLLEEPDYAARLGLAAFSLYRREYTQEIMTRRLESLFVELTQAKRG
jgi:glycosyltransferase involved in cell wall biosynthesis